MIGTIRINQYYKEIVVYAVISGVSWLTMFVLMIIASL